MAIQAIPPLLMKQGAQGAFGGSLAPTPPPLPLPPGAQTHTAVAPAPLPYYPTPDPGSRSPLNLPTPPPVPGSLGVPYQPPAAGPALTAPTPTPYGTFTAPDPTSLGSDPSYQFDLDQQQKALQRSAAARGTLLTGGALKALQTNASGLASQHYGDIYNRARGTYETNRATNAQNFDQSLGSFHAAEGAANDAASEALNQGHLGFDISRDTYGRGRDAYQDQLDDYQRRVAAARMQAGL